MSRGDDNLVVGVYVDDLAIVYNDDAVGSLYYNFTTALRSWNVEDEGELEDLLNVQFAFHDGAVKMYQSNYIDKMVSHYFPDGVATSFQANKLPFDLQLPQMVLDACSSDEPPDADVLRRFQSLVGALMYCATNTRPDISYPVGMLCRAMSRPTPVLVAQAERVLMYLHRTRELGLTYERSDEPLYGMTDSDWAVKHSTSGMVFMLNQATICWGSKKQTSVALSSCEAEIMAASEAAKESIHLSGLARELGLLDDGPIDLHMDNRSGIDVAYNPEHHGRMKHVERRHFFIRECVENHRLRVPFVRTVDNIADFFTKPLAARAFFPMRDMIMNVPRARGGVEPSHVKRVHAAPVPP